MPELPEVETVNPVPIQTFGSRFALAQSLGVRIAKATLYLMIVGTFLLLLGLSVLCASEGGYGWLFLGAMICLGMLIGDVFFSKRSFLSAPWVKYAFALYSFIVVIYWTIRVICRLFHRQV